MLLAERLGQKPGASIPGACENWAETTAAYRFLGRLRIRISKYGNRPGAKNDLKIACFPSNFVLT